MVSRDPALSVLVLTEDGSPWAFKTIRALARQMLRFVDRHTATHRVRFEPGDKAMVGARANRWRSRSPRDRPALVDLRRELSTKILEDDVPGYVLFHFDGDRPWSQQNESDNANAFQSFVQSLRPLIERTLQQRGVSADEAAIDRRLRRICPVTPYYSIESWLYQNLEIVRDACRRGCGRHLGVIKAWEDDRSLLDEVIKPKTQLCIGSTKNAELAEAFTSQLADQLYELEQSFHAAIELLGACPALPDALALTWSASPRA